MAHELTLDDRKAALRKEAFARRRDAHRAAGSHAADKAAEALHAAFGPRRPAIVAGYARIRTEIEPLPAMERFAADGARLCLPVIQGPGQPLVFREWQLGAELVEGPFGAAVPATGEALDPDLLICPLVAFDRACWRLGYGGGFYDRSLARLTAIKPVTAVGLAYAGQEVAEIPRDANDRRLDAIATEAGLITPAEG